MPDPTPRVLHGRRIVITRPREQSARLAMLLESMGATAIVAPAIAIAPPDSWAELDDALRRIELYDWLVVTSSNAAQAFRDRAQTLAIDPARLAHLRVAAVGPASAAPLLRLIPTPVRVAREHRADALGHELADVRGHRILFPRGDLARELLPAALRAQGAHVDAPIVYRTVPGGGLADVVRELAGKRVDALVFASPSAVHAVAAAAQAARVPLAAPRLARPAIFCLGPFTAEAAREHLLSPDGVGESSLEDLVAVITDWYSGHVAAR